jgi:hypothetical protein
VLAYISLMGVHEAPPGSQRQVAAAFATAGPRASKSFILHEMSDGHVR